MKAGNMANLNSLSKANLIKMIEDLKIENTVLKEMHEVMLATNRRLEKLEREQNLNFQYQRRDTIEISGIPPTVKQEDLEGEIVKIYEAAGVEVDGKKLKVSKIQACHRIGKKNVTICKFVSRKWAYQGVVSGKNLKDKAIYGQMSNVYINTSFCNEFRYLNYVIRKAKASGKIFRWKIKNGVNYVKVAEDDEFCEVSHKNDLTELDITIESE